MSILIWSDSPNGGAHACAMTAEGLEGPSVFDISTGAKGFIIYDYVNSQDFPTAHLKSLDVAKGACEMRYGAWLASMGLVAVAPQDKDAVLEGIGGYWRTPSQINGVLRRFNRELPARRLERALAALIADGRIEVNSRPTGDGSTSYRRVVQ